MNSQVYAGEKPLRKAFFFKYMIGNYFVLYAWIIPFCIFYLVPWGDLYELKIYSGYIEFVKNFLPVLENIKESEIEFKEYAISYLAFINIFGSIIGFFILIYGFYSIKISNIHNMLNGSLRSVIVNFFLLISAVLIFSYAIFFWDGSIPAKFFQLPILRKDAFIAISLVIWWTLHLFLLSIPVITKVLIKKHLTHRSQL